MGQREQEDALRALLAVLEQLVRRSALDPAAANEMDDALATLDFAVKLGPHDSALPQALLDRLAALTAIAAAPGSPPHVSMRGFGAAAGIAETPGMVEALARCLTTFPNDAVLADAAGTALGFLVKCSRARKAVAAAPGALPALVVAAKRNDGAANGHATAFSSLSVLIRYMPAEAAAWARDDALVAAAIALAPGLAEAAARLIAGGPHYVSLLCARVISFQFNLQDPRAAGASRAAAGAALAAAPRAAPALLKMLSDGAPLTRLWAAEALQGAAFEDASCAQLLAMPAALPALVDLARRPLPAATAAAAAAGGGDTPRDVAMCTLYYCLEAIHNLLSAGDARLHDALLRLAVPPDGGGPLLAALCHHLREEKPLVPQPGASVLAALCERAAAEGVPRLRGVSRAPGLADAAAFAVARAAASGPERGVALVAAEGAAQGAGAAAALLESAASHLAASVGNLLEALDIMTGADGGAPLRDAAPLMAALRALPERARAAGAPAAEDAAAAARLLARLERAEAEGRVCGACGALGGRLLHCTRCASVRYCNVACQQRHWREGHKQASGGPSGSSGGGGAPGARPPRACGACGKTAAEAPDGKLRSCRGCRAAYFCSAQCYQWAWREMGYRDSCAGRLHGMHKPSMEPAPAPAT
ncbi:MAG: hypothetical protein J3K34DRAFT_525316 [Monoraphidium minutum]|nr:MAG: hypothetical protein J3K34DRAFT_525316 [Monoraphidium minutum]